MHKKKYYILHTYKHKLENVSKIFIYDLNKLHCNPVCRGIELYVECSLQTVGKLFPELITPSTLDKYELVLQRFGFRDLNLASLVCITIYIIIYYI